MRKYILDDKTRCGLMDILEKLYWVEKRRLEHSTTAETGLFEDCDYFILKLWELKEYEGRK